MSLHKNLLASALALSAMSCLTSCIDEATDEEKFSVSIQGYVIQSRDADSTLVYKPYLTVGSTNYDYPLKSVTMTAPDGKIEMSQVTDYVYEMNPDDYATKNIKDLNGQYFATVTATSGLVKTTYIALSLSEKDTLSVLKPKSITYDGSVIKVKTPKVENAATYGVTIVPFNKDSRPRRIDTYYKIPTVWTREPVDSTINYEVSFLRTQLGCDSAHIRAYVSGTSGLFEESDTIVRIAK